MGKRSIRDYGKQILAIEKKGASVHFPNLEINPPETWPRNVHHHSTKSAGLKHRGESYAPARMGEIYYLYRAAYRLAQGPRKIKILGNYFGLVPWLAFAHNSWSYKIWKAAISSEKCDRDSNRLLKAIARGITTRRFEKNRPQEARRLAAKEILQDLMSNYRTIEQYRNWHESFRACANGKIPEESYLEARKIYLVPILKKFQQAVPGAATKIDKKHIVKLMVEKGGLRPAAEYVVSKVTSIPVRYLQAK